MATRTKFILVSLISFVLNVQSQYEGAGFGMPIMSLPDSYMPYMNYYQPQTQMMEPLTQGNNTTGNEQQNNSCSCYCDTCSGLPYCCTQLCFNCYGVPPDNQETTTATTPTTVIETTTQPIKKATCPPLSPCPINTHQSNLRAYEYKTKPNQVKTHHDFENGDRSKWIPKFGIITLPESIAEKLAQDLHALIKSQLAEQMSRNPHHQKTGDMKFPGPPDRPIIPVFNLETHNSRPYHNHNGNNHRKDYPNKFKDRFKTGDLFTKEKIYPDPVIEELVKSLSIGKKPEY